VVVAAEAVQLLISLVSETTFVSSEHASKKYVPLGRVEGTVTVVLPLEVAADASEGTERLLVRRVPPLFEVVVDR